MQRTGASTERRGGRTGRTRATLKREAAEGRALVLLTSPSALYAVVARAVREREGRAC